MRVYDAQEFADLAKECNDLEEQLAEHERAVRDLKLSIEAVTRVLGQKMDDAALDSIVTNGYRWSPAYEPYPSVTDPPTLRTWATTHMPDNLTLPWQTLRTVVKDALDPDAGSFALPPGVDIYVKRTFRRTKQ